MNWTHIKNFVIGGGLVVVYAITMGFIDWRVGVHVEQELKKQDLGTDTKIVQMDSNIANNASATAYNKEEIEELEGKLRDVANILMAD